MSKKKDHIISSNKSKTSFLALIINELKTFGNNVVSGLVWLFTKALAMCVHEFSVLGDYFAVGIFDLFVLIHDKIKEANDKSKAKAEEKRKAKEEAYILSHAKEIPHGYEVPKGIAVPDNANITEHDAFGNALVINSAEEAGIMTIGEEKKKKKKEAKEKKEKKEKKKLLDFGISRKKLHAAKKEDKVIEGGILGIGKEFIDIFIYSASGILSVFMGLFYEWPKYFIENIPKWIETSKEHSKDNATIRRQNLAELPNKIKEKIASYFNNSIFMKNYRNKKLLEFENLTTLQIDRNSSDAVRSANKITFRYLVKNADGKFIKGYFSAFSKLDCHSYLLDEGYEVYKIETSKWIEFTHGERKSFKSKFKKKDLIFWLAQLSTYIRSGVPLTDAAKILAAQDKRTKYKKIYDELIYELTMGESFAKALEKQDNVFPALLINMIKAAEMMGDIEDTLDDMANYYTEIESTKREMISAMTYPMIVSVFAVAIIVFILTYIIPQFTGIYNQANIEMNSMTLAIVHASDFLKQKWYMIILVVVGATGLFLLLYKNNKAFKTLVQYLLMHVPVVGKIMIYNEMVLFSKTFASLQKNNVLLTDSIDILSKITNNEIYKVIMLDTITNLLKGDKMSDSFKDNWAIPELAFYMISTGERTGDLANMLDKVAKYYQDQQKAMVTTMKAFIEPIMIAGLAVVVGGIIIAAILPMFSMYGQLM